MPEDEFISALEEVDSILGDVRQSTRNVLEAYRAGKMTKEQQIEALAAIRKVLRALKKGKFEYGPPSGNDYSKGIHEAYRG